MMCFILFILFLINNSIPLGHCNTYVEHIGHLSYKQRDHLLSNNNHRPLDENDYDKPLDSNRETGPSHHPHKNDILSIHQVVESHNAKTNPIHIVYSQSVPTTTMKSVQETSEYLPKNAGRYSVPDYIHLHAEPGISHNVQGHRTHGPLQTVFDQNSYYKAPLNDRPFERLELLPTTVNDSKAVFDFEDKAHNTTGSSERFQNEDDRDNESMTLTENPISLDESLDEKEDYLETENKQLFTTQAPQRPVRTKTIQIAQPALKAKTFEIRLPAIQKEFYDIEERFLIKPAGAIVVELDNPISKIPKGETILPLGHPHPLVSNAYQQNGKSKAFSNIIYSSTKSNGSHERHTLASTTKDDKNRKDAYTDDQNAVISKKADLRENPSHNPSNNSSSFEVEYLDGTFMSNVQHNRNNFNQFGQYREVISPLSYYPSTSKTYQHDFTDRNEEQKNPEDPFKKDVVNGQSSNQNVHDVQRENSGEFKVAHYSKPYANVRLHTNTNYERTSGNLFNVNNSQNDKQMPFNKNNQNLNAPFTSLQNLNNNEQRSNPSSKHENDVKLNVPLKNIIVYANLKEIVNRMQHDYTEKGPNHGTQYNNGSLPFKNIIIYGNSNRSSNQGHHQYNENTSEYGKYSQFNDNRNNFENTANNKERATGYNIEEANADIVHQYKTQRDQQASNGQKFMRLIERPKNNQNNIGRLVNYANEFNADTDTEKIDMLPTFLSDIDAVPGSRIIASTPASKDPSLINESVQTRRIVINHPFHTVREIVEHEPYTNYHEIEIEEPDLPEIFKTGHYILSNSTQSY